MSLFAALFFAASAGQPAPPTLTVSVTIDVAGLDFGDPDDVKIFDARARIAVKQVCGDALLSDLAEQNEVDACRAKARAALNIQRDNRIAAANGRATTNALVRSSQ